MDFSQKGTDMKRLLKYSIITSLTLLLLAIFLVYFGANYPGARFLYGTEKDLARSVYDSSLNVNLIQIVFDTPYTFGTSKAIGNTIHIKAADYSSPESLENNAFLIHEFGHVWQYQNHGWSYIPNSLIAQFLAFIRTGSRSAAYNWETSLNNGVPWEKLNPEEQAESITEYFYYRELSKDATIHQQELKRILERFCFIPFLRDGLCERK